MATKSAHILVFPYPAPGHMMPLLELTNQLATRGITITILITPGNLSFVRPLLSKHPLIETLVVPFPPHPYIPAGVENVKDLPPTAFPAMMESMRKLHTPIFDWFRNSPSPPVAIISDMFLWWTHNLAEELGIQRFMFSSSGVMAMSIIYSLRRYPPEIADVGDPNKLISLETIPNSPSYPWWQLQILCSTSFVEGDPISEFIKEGILANMASSGIVFNSFSELERVYLDHVMNEAGHNRVWAVGPLIRTYDRDDPVEKSYEFISTWLDMCEDRTVVYVCFGTQAVLGKDQVETIAAGLEKSGVKFIWCVKRVPHGHVDGYDLLPPGFVDRVAGRGLIVREWVPQMKILSHRAVESFLTHCGWNSVLEGLVAGVTMLAWPIEGDQFLNAALLVEELKVAIRLCEGIESVPNADELARVLVDSLEKSEARSVKVEELARLGLDAMKNDGSSYRDLDNLVMHISNIETSRK